ncbi:hypothetical protein [Cohnella thailandensis]|uniref:Uncharacterized protein n=1 Tax=Cohnella thailandensis TaxID=557557 RepID=A0A841T2B9_9BACL|nr:hypothetical protein [Cohnella thailandensis]MBB6636996.1 hypothetical protein [Cohnella thailandensis]MBP1973120.1 hypothetical protein [Cohnella thailandensis]
MPYALRHIGTGELLAGKQANAYQLAYYGLLLWDDEPDEEQRFDVLMKSERFRALAPETIIKERHAAEWEQVQELSRWKITLITEQEAKLGNVKLRNDPSLRIFMRGGQLLAEPAE